MRVSSKTKVFHPPEIIEQAVSTQKLQVSLKFLRVLVYVSVQASQADLLSRALAQKRHDDPAHSPTLLPPLGGPRNVGVVGLSNNKHEGTAISPQAHTQLSSTFEPISHRQDIVIGGARESVSLSVKPSGTLRCRLARSGPLLRGHRKSSQNPNETNKLSFTQPPPPPLSILETQKFSTPGFNSRINLYAKDYLKPQV